MPPKRLNTPAPSTAPQEEQFWAPPAELQDQRSRMGEQISRLQQRQLELVQETAKELEELKHQLSEGSAMEEHITRARQPLILEISNLRTTLANLEAEKRAAQEELVRVQSEYQGHYVQMQGALNSLKNIIRSQARAFDQQVRVFSLDATQTIEGMLSSVDAAAVPSPELKATKNVSPDPRALPDTNLESLLAEFPLPATPSRAMAQEVRTEKPRVLKEKKPRSFKGVKRLALRTAVLALMATAGWTGVQALQDKEAGQVAGVTTATTPIPDATLTENPANKYKESFATVPFAQTEWENFADPDLGFTVRYPKNATNIVRTSTNAWFLRYDGYFLKVTVETTNDQLDGWWAKSKGFYEEGNTISKGTFKSRPAYIIRPTEPTKSSGTTYFVASKTGVTHIFVRDELDPETDDAKRITSMVNSLTLTN